MFSFEEETFVIILIFFSYFLANRCFSFLREGSVYMIFYGGPQLTSIIILGVLKKTDDNRWAHVLCSLYIAEVRFGNNTTMEPIIISAVAASSFGSKICYICEEMKNPEKQYGVCLPCHKPSCKVVFHVTCAQGRGLLCEEKGELRFYMAFFSFASGMTFIV